VARTIAPCETAQLERNARVRVRADAPASNEAIGEKNAERDKEQQRNDVGKGQGHQHFVRRER
jgi:hypothetical protein